MKDLQTWQALFTGISFIYVLNVASLVPVVALDGHKKAHIAAVTLPAIACVMGK